MKKVALITGASSGIGKCLSIGLASHGFHTIMASRDLSKLNAVKSVIDANGDRSLIVELDICDENSIRKLYSTVSDIGTPDIIINNAGIAIFTPFENRTFDDFMNVMKINAGGTFLCIQEGSRLMREDKKGGSIINIGSIYGIVSSDPRIYNKNDRKNAECYGASKAAIIHMTKYFAVHLAEFDIRVNCISPGGVFNNQGKDFVKNYSSRVPMSRMANEDEIADTAIFLSSEDSSYITGQNFAIDGGLTSW